MFAASKTASASGGYQISRSLRFNSPDSAYLNRTPATATNRKTWTWSGWIKRSNLSASGYFFTGNSALSDAGFLGLNLGTADKLEITGWVTTWRLTTQVFRDPSAWYHFVIALDTTQATANNRIRLYVNGSEVTVFDTTNNPTQNADLGVNTASPHYLSTYDGTNNKFNGYMTEVNFIDGQALTPSSFGETNAQTGVWQPKAFAGTYGTNGFYLNFSDNSNTTAATLGKDYSGNGNNWTPNNFSVTAGAGNDSLIDSPTSYGVDTGAGGTVRGNYGTWNPLKTYNATFTNGNLDASVAATSGSGADVGLGCFGMSSGKWYWEVTCNSITAAMIGISDASASASSSSVLTANGWAYYSGGQKYNNNSGPGYAASFTNGDIIGVALDMDAGTLAFYKNGASQGVAYSTGLTGKTMIAMVGTGSGSVTQTYSANFGQRAFAYTAPSDFKALCTQNLPTPTIGANGNQAGNYFGVNLWTGNLTARSFTNSGFQPGLVWWKCRDFGYGHVLTDQVRGVTKQLGSSTTDVEQTYSGYVTSFDSSGFSIAAGDNGSNGNGINYVGWQWKANGTGSSNTVGSITSTVSANTTSLFSVVTYTGTGVAGTIGHGLNVAPSMIIVKSRSLAGAWPVYFSTLGNGSNLVLNTTAATATSSTIWNSTSPTSSVFSVGINTDSNTVTVTYVAYCFAEVAGYSKFGSYTGNGSTDGPFVFTGMRPAYVMIKRTDSTSDWYIWDTKRDTYNVVTNTLLADTAGAETSATSIDDLSNGFKCRSATVVNASSGTYIYMAFAESPFKYSLAR